MALKRFLEPLHRGGALLRDPRPQTLLQQTVLNGFFSLTVQPNFSMFMFQQGDVAVILKPVTCANGHGLVGPIARCKQSSEVPRTVCIAELHGPEHTPLRIQQVRCTHALASRTRVLKSPLNGGKER